MAEVLFYETVIGKNEDPTCRVSVFIDEATGLLTRAEMFNAGTQQYRLFVGSASNHLLRHAELVPDRLTSRPLPALAIDFRVADDIVCGIEGV